MSSDTYADVTAKVGQLVHDRGSDQSFRELAGLLVRGERHATPQSRYNFLMHAITEISYAQSCVLSTSGIHARLQGLLDILQVEVGCRLADGQ